MTDKKGAPVGESDLEKLRSKVLFYSQNYRRDDVGKIEEGEIYGLSDGVNIRGCSPRLYWPAVWPNADARGVYAIFSHEKLLYIGKASQQALGNRLSSYFQYGKTKSICITNPQHNWSSKPTHVVTWAVPKEMFFEASALEEYLINELKNELPDNTAGKNA